MRIKELFPRDYIICDKTHFSIIKGISIFVIVLVHLCNRYINFTYLSPFAGAAVAVFLICSGYGLSESFEKKQGTKGFWYNKIVKVWLPSFLKLSVVSLIMQSGAKNWLMEYPLFLYGWYLQVLFVEYFVFYLAFRFVKQKMLRIVILFSVSMIAFLLLKSQLYAEQVLCFPIGVLVSQMGWKQKIEKWGNWKRILLIGVCVSLTLIAFLLRKQFTTYIFANAVWLVFKLSIAVLLCLIPYFLRKTRVLGMFIPLGTMSYMLYLINNDVLSLLEGNVQWYTVIGVLVLLGIIAAISKKVCDILAVMIDKVSKKCLSRSTL